MRVRVAGEGVIRLAELDTSYFLGNNPDSAMLQGLTADGDWVQLVPRTCLQPDTRHRFLLEDHQPVTEVRLDIYPDGGLSRLRLSVSSPRPRNESASVWLGYGSFGPRPRITASELERAHGNDASLMALYERTFDHLAELITSSLTNAGLRYDWDGDTQSRIQVIDMSWGRPLPTKPQPQPAPPPRPQKFGFGFQ